jgi:predicted nucleic acid-binding protein
MTLVVVDFNVVFSALVSRGKPLRAFELNEVFNKFEYISTQYMYTELDNHLDEIMSSSKLSREESS